MALKYSHLSCLTLVGVIFTWIQGQAKPISFSPIGNWSKCLYHEAEQTCVHEFLCSHSNLTWQAVNALPRATTSQQLEEIDRKHQEEVKVNQRTASRPFVVYNSTTGCEALLRKGIRKIYYHGDSYMRQMYTGMFLLLSGNYRNGSLRDDPGSIGCEYHKQLYEKRCGVQQLNHNGFVLTVECAIGGGKVHLDPLLYTPTNLGHCSQTDKNVVLLSLGNHKTRSGNGGRWGVNNATLWQEWFEGAGTCNSFRAHTNTNCSVYWVSTHYRVVGWFGDETPEYIKQFNEEMRDYFDQGKCGQNTGYIDVYNMTAQLAKHWPDDANAMTFDRVHWGMQVNLLKGIIILNAIMASDI